MFKEEVSFVEKSMENIVMNPINIATFAIENLEKCLGQRFNEKHVYITNQYYQDLT